MHLALILLSVIVGTGAILYVLHRLRPGTPRSQEAQDLPSHTAHDPADGCCGLHEVCEKKAVADTTDLYYNDEELDSYRGRSPESYTDTEIEQWRDILLTLRPHEVAPWSVCIRRRGLQMPTAIHDEMMLMLSEMATTNTPITHRH